MNNQLYQMFIDAISPKSNWGTRKVRALFFQTLRGYEAQYGALPNAGALVSIMMNCLARKPGWGCKQLAEIMAYAMREARIG